MEVYLMKLLAGCSLEKSKEFTGNLVLPNEDKKNPDKVLLNIVVNDGNTDVFKHLSGKEHCITFVGEPTSFCPTELEGKVFNEVSLDEIINNEGTYPSEVKGVTTLIRVPDDYHDMRFLREVCTKFPTARIIGGNLLGIDGVRIGRYESTKKNIPVVYKDIYDDFVEVNLEDLNGLQEIVKKTRKRAESIKSFEKKAKKSGTPKVKKPPKRAAAFSKLFDSSTEVEF